MPLMEEVERQLEELDEEDKKREVERNRQKIHKAFMSRPVKTVVFHHLLFTPTFGLAILTKEWRAFL